MGKRKRQRRRHKTGHHEVHKFAGVYFAPHPFNGADHTKLRDALLRVGTNAVQQFDTQVAQLQGILDSVDALQAIACLTTYGLTATVGKDGKIGTTYKGSKFTQAHVELCLAIALRTAAENRGSAPASADTIQKLFDLLPEIAKTFQEKRLARLSNIATDEERHIAQLQDHLRLHTQAVRNWGYFDEVVSTLERLVAPLDDAWESAFGLPASWLVRFFRDRVKDMEDRFVARLAFFREIDKATNIEDFLARLIALFPTPQEHYNDFVNAIRKHPPLSRDQRRVAAFHYADAIMDLDFISSVGEIAQRYDVKPERVDVCLRRLSHAFGDLRELRNDSALLHNPVWTRPLVSLGDGIFYCALPQGFFSFSFHTLNEIAAGDSKLHNAWTRRKAEFLEHEIETIFRNAFPQALTVRNFQWKHDGIDYENDLLVQIGSHVIIIEAKSGSVSWPALRGAPDRAKRHFRELIIDPSIQSHRLQEKIEALLSDPQDIASTLPSFPFDISAIKKVLRLSVTLEDFAVLQTNIRLAQAVGWVPNGHQLPPTMILADLRAVFDILGTKAEKIHYLQRRQTIQRTLNYVGDEMDLLGIYLANGFDLGDVEGSDASIVITGMSASVDEFFDAKANGITRVRPERKLTRWWRDICLKFEERDFEGWTEAATMLLDVGHDVDFPQDRRHRRASR